ncbi:MAG: tetratricopeptide repeat protein [Myxococcales bacterium]|nr:tetratricopeptide repeat protein [Myxococcales bacterium]
MRSPRSRPSRRPRGSSQGTSRPTSTSRSSPFASATTRRPRARSSLAFKDAQQRQNLEAQLGYGVALRGLKRFDEAKRAYLAAAKIDPDDPRAQFNLGVLNQDHVASDGEVSNAKTAKYFTIAEQHFQRFLEIAGKRAEYKTEVLEARDRLASIDETREIIRNAEIIEEEIKRLNAQAAAEREAEIKRLKELEARARGRARGRARRRVGVARARLIPRSRASSGAAITTRGPPRSRRPAPPAARPAARARPRRGCPRGPTACGPSRGSGA